MTASFHCCWTFPSRQMWVVSRWNSTGWSGLVEVRVSAVPREARPAPLLSRLPFAFIAVATSSSVGSIQSALATGCCGSLFGMSGSSMSDLEFSSERTNRTHLSRIRPLSRSSLPPSSRTHCDSTFLVSSSCTDWMFWKNLCWSPMRNCFFNSTTWRSKKTND